MHFRKNLTFLQLICSLFFFPQRAKLLKQKKEEGNDLFKSRDWSKAYEAYGEALGIDPCNKFVNAKLYLNRAIVAAKVRSGENIFFAV